MPDSTTPSSPSRDAVTGTLLAARRHCRIQHHVPGRLRLRFDPVGLAAALPGRRDGLSRLLESIAGIHGIEINPIARSLIVTYDPARLAPLLWHHLVAGNPAEAEGALDNLLGAIVPAAAST